MYIRIAFLSKQKNGGNLARINIEDSLFKDDRFLELIAILGNKTLALGAIVEAFILAQKHYLNESNDRLIPIVEFQRSKYIKELNSVGFIEIKENGVYVKGSENQFGWLLQRSKAGKKSSLSKSNIKELSSTTVDRNESEPIGGEPLALAHSLALSLNSNSKLEQPLSTEPKKSVTVATTKIKIKISDSKTIEVNKDLVSSWADTYPKDFLNDELKKARNWVLSNPHKAPKAQWGKFLNNWFNRSWDRYRTTLKSNPIKVTMEDLNEVLGGL